MTTNPSYLTVTALTRYLKKKFDVDPHLRKVFVKGELSNVKYHSNGHIYFTLKDGGARIACAMFSSQAKSLSFRAEEGMNVFIVGDISIYESAGNYQLYAKSMEPDGVGALFVAYEQLKKKLQSEGLFDSHRKQSIPKLPTHIGVITSPTGAAIRDILTTLERRFPLAQVTVYSALVQGSGATESIVKAIERANRDGKIDVLIVGRGGGSIEDLWAFNEEAVVRAISDSSIPIISAVGHETDTTIADFVSDLRAPTPTAAAELAVPDRIQLLQYLDDRKLRLRQLAATSMQQHNVQLKRLQTSLVFTEPGRIYRPFLEQHSSVTERLNRAFEKRKDRLLHDYTQKSIRLQSVDLGRHIKLASQKQMELSDRLQYIMTHNLQREQRKFVDLIRTLEALSPLQTLQKGFVLTKKEDKLIKSSEQLEPGDTIGITYHDGTATAVVQSIAKDDSHELHI